MVSFLVSWSMSLGARVNDQGACAMRLMFLATCW
jgi:hypothetical protein